MVLDLEIEKLKRALGTGQSMDDKKCTWTPETIAIARNAVITGVLLVSLYIFCGLTPMSFYTASIFQETGSNLSPNMSAIVIAAIQLIGTCIATELVERAGRKVSCEVVVFALSTSCQRVVNKFIISLEKFRFCWWCRALERLWVWSWWAFIWCSKHGAFMLRWSSGYH